MKRKDLVKAATELNEVMGLKPAIDVTADDAKLTEAIINTSSEITEDDEFSAATSAVLEELMPKDDDDEDDDDEDKDDDEDEEEVAPPPKSSKPKTLVETVHATARLADLKEIVNSKDEFKKLRKTLDVYVGLSGPKELKVAMFKALGVEPPAGPPDDTRKITILAEKNPKREGSKSFDRFALYKNGMTVADYIKKGGTAGDIAWDSKHKFISLS